MSHSEYIGARDDPFVPCGYSNQLLDELRRDLLQRRLHTPLVLAQACATLVPSLPPQFGVGGLVSECSVIRKAVVRGSTLWPAYTPNQVLEVVGDGNSPCPSSHNRVSLSIREQTGEARGRQMRLNVLAHGSLLLGVVNPRHLVLFVPEPRDALHHLPDQPLLRLPALATRGDERLPRRPQWTHFSAS